VSFTYEYGVVGTPYQVLFHINIDLGTYNNNNNYITEYAKPWASKPQTNGINMPKPVCEEGDVTALWNQAVHADREVTANRSDIIIKNKKENMHTDRCGNTCRQKC
jgi:hypothetical protein